MTCLPVSSWVPVESSPLCEASPYLPGLTLALSQTPFPDVFSSELLLAPEIIFVVLSLSLSAPPVPLPPQPPTEWQVLTGRELCVFLAVMLRSRSMRIC